MFICLKSHESSEHFSTSQTKRWNLYIKAILSVFCGFCCILLHFHWVLYCFFGIPMTMPCFQPDHWSSEWRTQGLGQDRGVRAATADAHGPMPGGSKRVVSKNEQKKEPVGNQFVMLNFTGLWMLMCWWLLVQTWIWNVKMWDIW